MNWILLGIILILQNVMFVLNSRARNGSSLKYHALTNLGSNGVYFISLGGLYVEFNRKLHGGDWGTIIPLGLFYVACNLVGGLGAHWFSLRTKR